MLASLVAGHACRTSVLARAQQRQGSHDQRRQQHSRGGGGGGSSSSSSNSSSSSRNSSSSSKAGAPSQRQQASSSGAPDDGEWLAKALAAAGVASRRACVELVRQGRVRVNGAPVADPATRVRPSDRLEVAAPTPAPQQQRQQQGRKHGGSGSGSVDSRVRTSAAATRAAAVPVQVLQQQARLYFAVNKPPGYICSNVSQRLPDKRAVDLLAPWLAQWQRRHAGQLPPRLYPVGRLDVATSGLLFLTNDGEWAQRVIHPSSNIIKEYHVELPAPPGSQQLRRLQAGTEVQGVHVTPKRVTVLPPPRGSARGAVLAVEVAEGRKHEVRKLVAAAGLELLSLKRVRVGGYVMPASLAAGGYVELGPRDVQLVFKRHGGG